MNKHKFILLLLLPLNSIFAQASMDSQNKGMSSWVFIVMLVIFVVVFTVNNKNKKGNNYAKTFSTSIENGGFENFSLGKGVFETDEKFNSGGGGIEGSW